MSLASRNVTSAPLDNMDVIAPDGTLVGIIGENGSGKSLLLRLGAGVRERPAVALARIRRAGATMLVVSHEEELIRRLADEVWWLHQGKLAGRGDPADLLAKYRK